MCRTSSVVSISVAFYLLCTVPAILAADLSVFSFAQDPDFDLQDLANGKVEGARAPAKGSALSISVETFYVLSASPDVVINRMVDSSSATESAASETLDIKNHVSISSPPVAADFAQFDLKGESTSRFGFGGSNMLEGNTQQLNLTKEEAEKINRLDPKSAEAMESLWKSLLLERAKAFYQGGLLNTPGYASRGRQFNLQAELVSMLKSRPKVLTHFQDLLGVAMTGKPLPDSLPSTYYWETSKLQGQKNITLAGIFSRPYEQGYQVLDCTHYVSGGYFTSMILYQIWPVEIEGKQQCLVWRGDYVISQSMNFLKGVERMAAENIMLLEIKKSVRSFINEIDEIPSP